MFECMHDCMSCWCAPCPCALKYLQLEHPGCGQVAIYIFLTCQSRGTTDTLNDLNDIFIPFGWAISNFSLTERSLWTFFIIQSLSNLLWVSLSQNVCHEKALLVFKSVILCNCVVDLNENCSELVLVFQWTGLIFILQHHVPTCPEKNNRKS